MRIPRSARGEEGFALLLVLLILLAVAAMSMAALGMVGNSRLMNQAAARQAAMEDAAMAGLQQGRALVNRRPEFFPDTGFVTLPADSLPLRDAAGKVIPGLKRTVYLGPQGIATGEYGIRGRLLSVVEDARGNRVIFHETMDQESFAKFSYFTNRESYPNGTTIYFAPGDLLSGPVHSNDIIHIMTRSRSDPKAVFLGPVTTARTVSNPGDATFKQGLTQGAGRIEMPDVADLGRLASQAAAGGTAFSGTTAGTAGQATTRVEFLTIDLNDDGDGNDDGEGFYRVYQTTNATSDDARFVVAARPSSGDIEDSYNCGHRHVVVATGEVKFYLAREHDRVESPYYDYSLHKWVPAHTGTDPDGKSWDGTPQAVMLGVGQAPRCYLGGSDSLNVDLGFSPTDPQGRGGWLKNTGSWPAGLPGALTDRPDFDYLFPLDPALNPSFKGVVYVAGNVAVSGVVNGRVTVAAAGNIVVADDAVYANDPGGGSCHDMLGLFAGKSIVVSDNLLNTPASASGSAYRTYDNTSDEVVHAVLLTLQSFTVENYDSGPTKEEKCQGEKVGRGCLFVTGGIIQERRGPVGQSDGTGYLKRYSYDQCASLEPPPYFPTTGYFSRGKLQEINPVGFSPGSYFMQVGG